LKGTTLSKFTYEETKAYDLNIFYAEHYDEELGTYWDEHLTMQVYLYINDHLGSRTYEGDIKQLTLAETRAIAPDFPADEYGTDFWTGVDAFLEECKACPESITNWLNRLIDVRDMNPIGPPMVWYSQAS
jgi:hypothetical protein